MAWQQISPKYVRQDSPGLRAEWYRDTAARGGGELMVWLDQRDRIVAFQLSHEEWPSLRHYVAHWKAGSVLEIGDGDGDAQRHYGARFRPPAVPVGARAGERDQQAAARLLAYFSHNAAALDPSRRTTIRAVLGEGTDRVADAA